MKSFMRTLHGLAMFVSLALLLQLSSIKPGFALVDTLVQFDPEGAGNYTITGIHEFDWQSTGDLVIVNVLPFAQACGAGTCTTFSDWAANAVDGDSVVFDSYFQARLNSILDNSGSTIASTTLSVDGGTTNTGGDTCGANNCFEITAAANIRIAAVLTSAGAVIVFTSITGDYVLVHDASPDSDVSTGEGFIDGTAIITGIISHRPPNAGAFMAGVGGSLFANNVVTSYNSAWIETDPLSNTPLRSFTFDFILSLISNGEVAVGIGNPIGLDQYTVNPPDLRWKADANSEFNSECSALIGDLIWNDLDGDGIQDGNESGIPGVAIILTDINTAAVRTTTTGTSGQYEFDGLCSGAYKLDVDEVTLPHRFAPTVANSGSDENLDSDGPVNGGQLTITLVGNNTQDVSNDFGYMYRQLDDAVSIDIRKQGEGHDTRVCRPGMEVTFKIHVANSGERTLSNVRVWDQQVPRRSKYVGNLVPGASRTFTVTVPSPHMDFENVACASGNYRSSLVQDCDTSSVIFSRFSRDACR